MRYHTTALHKHLRQILLCIIFAGASTVSVASPETAAAESPQSWQQWLKRFETLAIPLSENSQDYIHCLEQQPDLKHEPQDIAALLDQIRGMSQTCQFLLDDLIRQYQQTLQPSPESAPENTI